MPSSKGYVRDFKQEYKTSQSSTKEKKNRAKRNTARRQATKAGKVTKGDGLDVDHRRPLSKGGSNAKSNHRVLPAGTNRSFKRTKTGAIK